MKSKKKLLEKSKLYAILDKDTLGRCSLENTAKKLCASGVNIIQLRDKKANKLKLLQEAISLQKILGKENVLFIINDFPDIAMITDCDGLHLGQTDLPLKLARKLLGKDKIIGISCHSLKQALKAQKEGADYIGIGPIFKTTTKPDYKPIGLETLRKINKIITIPFFAIGNINEQNIATVVKNGAKRVAVVRAILKAKNIKQAAKNLLNKLPS